MIILEVGLEEHDSGYWIKISEDGDTWYTNREESYTLQDGLKKRDEMMDRIGGRRG